MTSILDQQTLILKVSSVWYRINSADLF